MTISTILYYNDYRWFITITITVTITVTIVGSIVTIVTTMIDASSPFIISKSTETFSDALFGPMAPGGHPSHGSLGNLAERKTHGKTHGKTMGKPWENHGKTMGKHMKQLLKLYLVLII